uniref:hypothetical protein n=1 Tax=Pedobacter schmidteae TaxID=2201271 RepID=UPI0013CEB50D|nr:hypothetical protein [Pedobacter schmidteae]
MKRTPIESKRTKKKTYEPLYLQKKKEDFLNFLNEIQSKAEQRGLTEEILSNILNGRP